MYEVIGETLIKVQTVEWALHGIVAIASKHSKAKSRFKHLTMESFLSDDVENKKQRKQTLGQIKEFLQAVDFFREDIDEEIELFVDNRNTFIHDFYRQLNWRAFIHFVHEITLLSCNACLSSPSRACCA
ncbi:MAG TPA: hypothetical protein VK202_12175 [Bacteroidia bacterium]|nr:hypothetical protein [Bacteroidia bacterium]